MITKPINVVDYIVQRLAGEGIAHCFGVPGDYAFPVCDAVDRSPAVKWIGCSNELNASYPIGRQRCLRERQLQHRHVADAARR
jgi:TPP-dependent 2-oxoacid decarboxylase